MLPLKTEDHFQSYTELLMAVMRSAKSYFDDFTMNQLSTLPAGRSNLLLRALSQADGDLLWDHLEPVALNRGDVCIESQRPLTHVYFLDGGLGSTVMPDEVYGSAEIGAQGYEGLIGVPVILGAMQTPHKTFMQVGGPARRIAVAPLLRAIDESESLRKLLLRYVHVFQLQVGQTAYANARYNVEERLARWILMSADRLGSPLSLTHDFLSLMLGVRRPSVTDATHILEGERLIKASRGTIEIIDRAGLAKRSNGCYGVSEAEYERLIGPWR
ncbi:Crp/Fnr family transcriptional regulator [Rhizobium leguminosarum]|nr:Crp/Fnr family transcriptional regulator [Rhizobium leguminosarum]